jgi:hypothetical protein
MACIFPTICFASLLLILLNSARVTQYLLTANYVDGRTFLEYLWPGNWKSGSPIVSYAMRRYSSYNMTFEQATKCNLGVSFNKWGRKPKWREPLLEPLQPLLNFTTFIHTNLNILVMGDSVAIQFGQLLEEALGVIASSRTVVHNSWAGNEGVTIASTKSGGAIGLYRLTGMFLPTGEGQPLPNAAGGGWNRSHVEELMHHPNLNTTSRTSSHGKFDVLIFRIPHGWVDFDEITQDTIQESLRLAHELFGVRQAILIDIPFTNNILTAQDLENKKQTNEMIRQVAAKYPLYGGAGNRHSFDEVNKVTTLQFARWTDHLMEYNARAIGMLPADNTFITNKTYTLDRLGCSKKFPISIAQGCAEMAKAGDCQCRRNRISEDGMHWCLESIGGRLVAGIACLLTCMQQEQVGLRDCETDCNNNFMSLRMLDSDMFVKG